MDYYDIDITIKIVLIGESGVGKTNLLHRYTDRKFLENTKSTLGVDFISLDQEIGDSKVKIQFWDTAGQENFRAITKTYYKEVESKWIWIKFVLEIVCVQSIGNRVLKQI